MYSSSSDLTTIMIRRMFPSWRKDVDVRGALVMVTIMMMGLVVLIIMKMLIEKQYYDDVGGDGGSGRE